MIKIIKEVLKRENRYRYYEDSILVKEKYFWLEKTFWSDGYFVVQ